MAFTITLGWWIAPLAASLLAFTAIRLFWPRMEKQNGSMFPDFGGALIELIGYVLALIVSLIAFLVWALLPVSP